MKDEDENEPFDTEEFLENNREEHTPEDFKSSQEDVEDTAEWYQVFREDLFSTEILKTLQRERSREIGSNQHQEILNSVIEETDKDNHEAVISFEQDAELYSRFLDGHYHRVMENSTFYGFMLGKEIEKQRQKLEEDTETIEIELPNHYEEEVVEIDTNDQDEFWDTVIEYFANEAYRQNLAVYAVNHSNLKVRELMDHLTEITEDQTIMETDIEELLMKENPGRTVIEFKNGQSLDPYHEPFVEGLSYAKVDEKQV